MTGQKRSMSVGLGLLATLLISSGPRNEQSTSKEWIGLFTIRRSINANELVYEAGLAPTGFDTSDPIRTFWVMKSENGQVEALNGFERTWAYGVSVRSVSPDKVVFSLKALPDRLIHVRRSGKSISAVTSVNGGEAAISNIYIETDGRGLFPSIDVIEIRGRSLANGNEVTEKIGTR